MLPICNTNIITNEYQIGMPLGCWPQEWLGVVLLVTKFISEMLLYTALENTVGQEKETRHKLH